MGGGLKGRGRESIYSIDNAEELVRVYDGIDNPIGKAYTKQEFEAMLSPYFNIEKSFLHFFPARSIPFKVPKMFHRILDRKLGLLIYFNVRKK